MIEFTGYAAVLIVLATIALCGPKTSITLIFLLRPLVELSRLAGNPIVEKLRYVDLVGVVFPVALFIVLIYRFAFLYKSLCAHVIPITGVNPLRIIPLQSTPLI